MGGQRKALYKKMTLVPKTEGGERVSWTAIWRRGIPGRRNRKCKGREDRSMVSGGGQDSLTSKARPCATVVSERTRLPVLELQLCHFPAG